MNHVWVLETGYIHEGGATEDVYATLSAGTRAAKKYIKDNNKYYDYKLDVSSDEKRIWNGYTNDAAPIPGFAIEYVALKKYEVK